MPRAGNVPQRRGQQGCVIRFQNYGQIDGDALFVVKVLRGVEFRQVVHANGFAHLTSLSLFSNAAKTLKRFSCW
jgi:hypothetical protein